MQYQTNRMSLSRNICQKPDFGPNLGLKWPKFGPEIFFQPQNHKYLLDIMLVYHNMQNQQNILKKMAEIWLRIIQKWNLETKIIWRQLNISRTRFFLDMRFSRGVHRHFVLSFSVKKSWGQ